MNNIFVVIYDWFEKHKSVLYGLLAALVVVFAAMASQVKLVENISSFFDNDESGRRQSAIFENLKVKDKIIVMVSGNDNPDVLSDAGDELTSELQPLVEQGYLLSVVDGAESDVMDKSISLIYDNLPIYLEPKDYLRIDSLLSTENIDKAVRADYDFLSSPAGMVVGKLLMRDPLNIATPLMKRFERFGSDVEYSMYGNHIFSKDMSTMIMFAIPANGMGSTGANDKMVELLEQAFAKVEADNDVKVDYFGGPVVAVYNARQIKHDTMITLTVALLLIVVVILLSFRSRWAVVLVILPTLFGALFSLAVIWLVQGTVSAIAVGAGAAVFGISLSYSIHVISHNNHTHDPRTIVRELSYPLTVGSFTTIGAFAALMFTRSALLHDFGMFSALALIGTTLFCLVFLPHLLSKNRQYKKSRVLGFIERFNDYAFDRNKWIVGVVVVLTVVGAIFCNDVRFDSNMSNINYEPQEITEAESRVTELFGNTDNQVFIVCSNNSVAELCSEYDSLSGCLKGLVRDGDIQGYVSVNDFVIAPDEQRRRIELWNSFWDTRRERVIAEVRSAAVRNGFRESAFGGFEQLLNHGFEVRDYSTDDYLESSVLSDWVNKADSSLMLISRITISPDNKPAVYDKINSIGDASIVDRAYYSSQMVSSINDDFYFILFVSSLIVFIALLISYGRLELAVLSFLPMCVSWVIILGFMALAGIEFNIVNIILSTFIFGIGDDFSIFIMDGLLQDYKNGKKLLPVHKTAIFFSAFTTVVGMGALAFAKHPALQSIALISVLGMSVVVLVAYTIQPVLFRAMVTSHTRRGGFPYTIPVIINTFLIFVYFLAGCIAVQTYILLVYPLPIALKHKKKWLHQLIYGVTRLFLRTVIISGVKRINTPGEQFRKPAVIIANHQSFIDILLLLSTTPKVVMITNSWVWNSPFFGWIVRCADFCHTTDGYEHLTEKLRDKVRDGYSVVVFPEGTRSTDCKIQRFHKGAFYIADKLKLDIVPAVLYGTGMVSPKRQGFYIHRGYMAIKILRRIPYGDLSYGSDYREQAKAYRKMFVEQYEALCEQFNRTSNPYFKDTVLKNYIYKGPVLEWYMRIKVRLDGCYDLWDRIIPRKAVVTDIGCGYGQLSFMLGLLSPDRTIRGIDYDADKVSLAEHSFLCRDNISFSCGDMRTIALEASDAFVMNDCLHYIDRDSQQALLDRCCRSLNDNGMILVRDSDASQSELNNTNVRIEKWSTEIVKFNKKQQPLSFVDRRDMENFARLNSLELHIERIDTKTTETLYVFTKRKTDE